MIHTDCNCDERQAARQPRRPPKSPSAPTRPRTSVGVGMTTGEHAREMTLAVLKGVGFAVLISWAFTLFLVFLGAFVLAL